MNTNLVSRLSVFLMFIIFAGCCATRTYRYYTTKRVPVYQNLSEVRNSIKIESPHQLKNPGKIYTYGKYLFINEKMEGVHIIDNSNPSSPQFVSFIAIPGNGDIAVKNSVLYGDSYIDLVAFNISDPTNAKLVKRIEGIFPNPLDVNNSFQDERRGLLIEWVEKDTVIEYTYSDCGDNVAVDYDMRKLSNGEGFDDVAESSSSGNQTGKGGSMARLTIYQNYLYAVDRQNLQTFDISNVYDPKPWNKVNIGWNIETIFPYKDKLFIGSQTGMYIYDNSTPWNPTRLCEFRHARGCDPVVANDKYAYVTLRSGTRCAGNENELHILDITKITDPILLKSYPMQNPGGIGVDETTLFLCDGPAGLKVFDVKDPMNIQLLDWKSDLKNYDVIPLGNVLLMVGDDGLYQFDYTNPRELKLLSKISIVK